MIIHSFLKKLYAQLAVGKGHGCLLCYGEEMAKAWAKAFYKSKAWADVRTAALIRDGGMCQNPGCMNPAEEVHHVIELTPENIKDPRVALNLDNLKSLCKDCHFAEHRHGLHANERVDKILTNGYYYDNGVMKFTKVYIVSGAPAAGKSTYISKHKEPGDLLIDLDKIKDALGQPRESKYSNLTGLALNLREYLYGLVADRDSLIDCKHVWIAATLPNKYEREALAQRLDAEVIQIDVSKAECHKRVANDSKRIDKDYEHKMVDKYFKRLTEQNT